MSEIREKIVREAAQRATDSKMFPQIGTVLFYHDNADRCLCERHQGAKIDRLVRGTVDIQLTHGKRKKTYQNIGSVIHPSSLVDQNLKAGDLVLVQFVNGDIDAPIVTGKLQRERKERKSGIRMGFSMGDVFSEME